MRGDADDTVLLRPPVRVAGRGHRSRRLAAACLACLAALGVAALVFLLWPGEGSPRVADENAIDADVPARLAVFRFAPRRSIVVLDFPSLAAQGRMLDRVAALVEKNGLPHDRVLDDADLAAAIKADGDTPDTWYYGHDYRVSDLLRFFDLAASEGIALNADEQTLRRLLERLGARSGGVGAIISLPRALPGTGVDMAVRHVILHHELSHGYYFTSPAYVRAVSATWRDVLTGDERGKVRAFLASQEYDPSLTDLMRNEMQAYLVYTPEGAFFDPARLGIGGDRLSVIRDALVPAGPRWLVPSFRK